jgi:sugar phosphate isomerase/epimerase
MIASSRRAFLAAAGATSALCAMPSMLSAVKASSAKFKIGVITDEISQDFDHACFVIARDFGLQWVELREMWGKNLQASSDAEITEAQKILAKYSLQVTDIASPLFKVDWPDAPKSQYSPPQDLHGAAASSYDRQGEVLERSLSLARQFKTDKIRCFDFWRLDDIATHRDAINEKLRAAAETTAKQNVMLVIENEFACNTATGREAAGTLAAIPNANFALNWDPGNAVMRGELDAFPGGWNALPKNRIHHCHCKNAVKDATGKMEWSPVDKGFVDWQAQFLALKQMGYRNAINLETHWHGAGTPEASSRISWAGMKKCLDEANVRKL